MRRTEVLTGFILIITAFSYLASILLDFNFVSPYSSLQEDLAYLSEQIESQHTSSLAWLTTGALTLISVPLYLIALHHRLKSLLYINALFMLGAAAGFLLMGKLGFDLNGNISIAVVEGIEKVGDKTKFELLEQFRKIQLLRLIGSSCVGLFAMGLSLSKFKLKRFPLFSTGLLMICGPVLIFFNWYDPDHLIRTGAMAGIVIGMIVFSVRLINKGLSD